jgi:hypothetical protein
VIVGTIIHFSLFAARSGLHKVVHQAHQLVEIIGL